MVDKRNHRKTKTGIVVSDKMKDTCVVSVTTRVKHPLYKKVVKITKKFFAHDENNTCKVGDRVEIMETRPISKNVHFRVVKIIEKAK